MVVELSKKEAKGIGGDVDLGEAQEFNSFYVITEKGSVDRVIVFLEFD